MNRGILIFSFILLVSTTRAQSKEVDDSDRKACTELTQAGQPPWSVKSAEFVEPPTTQSFMDRGAKVTVAVPFCRIVGTVKPTPESDIGFELWLPPRAAWNEKFEGVGSGGSRGAIDYRPLMRALVRGYATVATDNGHLNKGGGFESVGRLVSRNASLTSAIGLSMWLRRQPKN